MKIQRIYDLGQYDQKEEPGFILGRSSIIYNPDLSIAGKDNTWFNLPSWEQLVGYVRAIQNELPLKKDGIILPSFRIWGPNSNELYDNVEGSPGISQVKKIGPGYIAWLKNNLSIELWSNGVSLEHIANQNKGFLA